MRQAKATAGIEVLHLEDTVHPDRGSATQARKQSISPQEPESTAQPPSSQLGPHDEQAHEPEPPTVGDDRAGAGKLAAAVHAHEALRIGLPEHRGIGVPRVPTLRSRPFDDEIELRAGKRAQLERIGLGRGHLDTDPVSRVR
jgi:hypothetical protein